MVAGRQPDAVILHALARRATASLFRRASGRGFPPLVGAAAFGATLTQTVPSEWIVVASVVTRGRDWLALGMWAALGAGTAAVFLYLGFHHLGWNLLAARYPELAASRAWSEAAGWLDRYGVAVLFAVMALPLPMPKLPVLAAAGLQRLPIAEVAVTILAGKAIKYGAYGYLAARFPGFARRLIGRAPAEGLGIGSVQPARGVPAAPAASRGSGQEGQP
jgi:membrane protein YqaA with SNARE-associated domain